MSEITPFPVSFLAGGLAGLSVDMALFPLDTIKTRLQSSVGFQKAGGFRSLFSGLRITAFGSFPSAGLFFGTYNLAKDSLSPLISHQFLVHMIAASIGETLSCIIRVPTEVIKQNMQTKNPRGASFSLYTGFYTTLAREIPFSATQFPIYEKLKTDYPNILPGIFGAISGAIAAAVTTPLDVAKTRRMLYSTHSVYGSDNPFAILRQICHEEKSSFAAVRVLFSGIVPRVMWISIGGFVFFGVYEMAFSRLVKIED